MLIPAQFKLYCPGGVNDTLKLLESAGETLIPSIKKMFEIYNPQAISAIEQLEVRHHSAFFMHGNDTDN